MTKLCLTIPKKVRIQGIEYTVERTKWESGSDDVVLGRSDSATNTIQINESAQSPASMLVTLWHEIAHLIFIHSGYRPKHEEKIVNLMSYGIAQVLLDNLGHLVVEEKPKQKNAAQPQKAKTKQKMGFHTDIEGK